MPFLLNFPLDLILFYLHPQGIDVDLSEVSHQLVHGIQLVVFSFRQIICRETLQRVRVVTRLVTAPFLQSHTHRLIW